jgi:hypothetical protein
VNAESEDRNSSIPRMGDQNLPVPDPTRLTTDQLRRELGALREILETRMDAADRATELQIADIRELFHQFDDLPAQMRQAIADRAKQHEVLVDEQFKRLETELKLRFEGVEKQFTERDVRAEHDSRANKEALDAALLAAKELVGVTNAANTAAQAKAEESTTKQIDALNSLIASNKEASDARINELKERIDRGGTTGFEEGARTSQSDAARNRQNGIALASVGLAAVALVVAVVSVILARL